MAALISAVLDNSGVEVDSPLLQTGQLLGEGGMRRRAARRFKSRTIIVRERASRSLLTPATYDPDPTPAAIYDLAEEANVVADSKDAGQVA